MRLAIGRRVRLASVTLPHAAHKPATAKGPHERAPRGINSIEGPLLCEERQGWQPPRTPPEDLRNCQSNRHLRNGAGTRAVDCAVATPCGEQPKTPIIFVLMSLLLYHRNDIV